MELKNYFAQDSQGNAQPNATCYLYAVGTENLVTGLTNITGQSITNPFHSDNFGLIQFKAPNGLYDLRVVSGVRDYRIRVQSNDLTDSIWLATEQADRAEVAYNQALVARDEALVARDVAQLSAGVYDDTTEGLSKTVDGDYFSTPSSELSAYLILYKNVAGVAEEIDRYPSVEKVALLDMMIRQDDNISILTVADPEGFVALDITPDKIETKNVSLSTDGVKIGMQALVNTPDYAFAITDELGYVAFAIDNQGNILGITNSTPEPGGDPVDTQILELNQQSLISAYITASRYNTQVARPRWDYNHFIAYGQSLSNGQEGWPRLSKVAKYGNLMLGDATRPIQGFSTTFDPVGGVAQFKPLVAQVQALNTGAIMADVDIAVLEPGAQNYGEDPLVGMLNFAKLQHNQRLMVSNDNTRAFVASACGCSGLTIEALSKGASPDLYKRLIGATTAAKAVATSDGKSYGIAAITFLQGESNYTRDDGTKDGYKALLSKLYTDMITDLTGISGQSEPPLFISYQTGASFTSDTHGLGVAMAQLELSEERDNWVMATPVYPYTDKSGHLDANGYRWVGKQFAKVYHRVVELGQDWKPLSPMTINRTGKEILIGFHVPCPPLVFDKPYVVTTATDYTNKGFTVLVNGVSTAISNVEIVADCVVKITLAADPVGVVEVRYAGKATYLGNGCLRDSDPTISDDNYEYVAGSGQYPSANIPALVGKPYPLHNWCVAFQRPTTTKE